MRLDMFHCGSWLAERVEHAAAELGFSEGFSAELRLGQGAFGDFQANGVLPYAKLVGGRPRALAEELAEALGQQAEFKSSGIELSVAGPGFLNFALPAQLLLECLQAYRSPEDFRKGFRAGGAFAGREVLMDYPSPNAAKQMHIGHLRPMVVGEAVRGLLELSGARVISDDHLGDWGTNFGTLFMAFKRFNFVPSLEDPEALSKIEELYKQGVALEKEHPELREVSRAELAALQAGDAENTKLWRAVVDISVAGFTAIYERLGIHPQHRLAESFYADKVGRVYEELTQIGLAAEDAGALVVFHEEHPRFCKQPFIIRKRDHSSNYASTDLATALYRVEVLGVDTIVYVTDARQKDHFEQLFLTLKKWFKAKAYPMPKLRHVSFGSILGADRKAIKTRSGEPLSLKAVLDEALRRAKAIVAEKSPQMPEAEALRVAQCVGIGAVRYADLLQHRSQDYVFSWDKLLSFEGNTAPYLLYTLARMHSIFRKLSARPGELEAEATAFEGAAELALARKLFVVGEVFKTAAVHLEPHGVCTYLHELCGVFNSFYNAEKVITPPAGTQARRLMLCARTLMVLELGLNCLGMETLERM